MARRVVACLAGAVVVLAGCSSEPEPTRMDAAAEDCDGYVVEELPSGAGPKKPIILWHPDLQAMQIGGADAVNCVFNSLDVSDQTRNRLNVLTDGDGEVELYEAGLQITGRVIGTAIYVDVDDKDRSGD